VERSGNETGCNPGSFGGVIVPVDELGDVERSPEMHTPASTQHTLAATAFIIN
jgi:hypothetical protein